MNRIDESKPFKPVNIAVLTVSDTRTPETDKSCFYFWSAANGYRQNEPEATQQLFTEISTAFMEDKAIVEGQQAMLEATGEGRLVDIVSDTARIHMRRTLERLQKDSQPAPSA